MSQKIKRKKTTHRSDVDRSNPPQVPFVKGSIVKIQLKNFMTYENIELIAGPYLNLVLGPNGSGKSAIVCAIILGLGGDPSVTGRASILQEYVKFGCKSAEINVELFNPTGDNYAVTRKLIITKGKSKDECISEWILNGRICSLSTVRNFISGLNIRVDNLCQFLPQERVVEFAKMNPQQLLENTEKAAGDKEMYDQHMKLVEFTKKIKDLESKRQDASKQVETESNLNERLAEEVKRVKQKEDYQKKIDLMQKKKPWLEFENVRREYVDVKNTLKQREQRLKQCQNKHAPLRENLKRAVNEAKISFERCQASYKPLKEARMKYSTYSQRLDRLFEETNAVLARFEAKKHEEQKRQQTIEKAKEEIEVLKKKSNDLVEAGDLQPQIDELNDRISTSLKENINLKQQKNNLTDEIENIESQKREAQALRRSLENVFNEKLKLLSRMNPNAHAAALWLNENREHFKGNVFLPIMTQINVKNKSEAKFVEKVIPMRDLCAFVFEYIDDLKKFNDKLFEDKRIRVNVVMKPPQSLDSFVPQVPILRLKTYGFKKYINETFTAPDAIMAYLCSQFRVHEIPIGDENVNANDVIRKEPKITRFYAGDSYYVVSTSRYDSEKVTSIEKIFESRYLEIALDEKRLAEITKKMESAKNKIELVNRKVAEVSQKISVLENELSGWQKEKKNLILKRDEKKAILMSIQRQETLIKRLESEFIDLDLEKNKAIKQVVPINKNKFKVIEELSKLSIKINECFKEQSTSTIKLKAAVVFEQHAKDILAEADSEFNNLKRDINLLKETKEKLQKEAQSKRAIAAKAVNIHEKSEIPEDLKQQFELFPDTLEELLSEIRNLHLRIESIAVNYDSNLVRDYNKRRELIRKRKEEVAGLNADIQVLKSELKEVKDVWIPPLQTLINKIDENFGKFMDRLGCAGDVILSYDNEEDFEGYGISIRVKFRDNETLKALSGIHQSGGERSVSTMIYMIALQELTKVPFRCVDEINQGMDNRNERRVFDFIVETASNKCSQYFLFSPKLLAGLDYTDRMHIHVVFNGPFNRFRRW